MTHGSRWCAHHPEPPYHKRYGGTTSAENNIVPMTGRDIAPENWWLGKWKFLLGWPIVRCYIHRSSSKHEKGTLSKAQSVKYNSSIHFFHQWEKLEWMLLTAMHFPLNPWLLREKVSLSKEWAFKFQSKNLSQFVEKMTLAHWFMVETLGGGELSLFTFAVDKALMDLTSLCARSGHLVILLLGKPKKMENRSGRQTYTNKKVPEKMMKEILGEVFSINHAPTVFGEIQRMPSYVTCVDLLKVPSGTKKSRNYPKKIP